MINTLASDTTDLVSAWGAALGGGATLIAASAGVAAAVVAIRTLKASKRDSQNRSRPMVGALLERDPHPSARTSDLVLRNYGQAVAYNVQVTFDPPLVDCDTDSGKPNLVVFLQNRYRNPIANLMPGVELRNIWYLAVAGDDLVAVTNDLRIPDLVTMSIKYSDHPNFWAEDANRYVDTFVLDATVLRAETYSTHSDDHLGLHKRSTKAIEKFGPAIVQVAEDLNRIQNYVKPESVRAQEAIDEAESLRAYDEMMAKLFPNRSATEGVTE